MKHAGIPLGMSAIYIHSTPIPRPLTFLSFALAQIFNQIDISLTIALVLQSETTSLFTFYFTLVLHPETTLLHFFNCFSISVPALLSVSTKMKTAVKKTAQ